MSFSGKVVLVTGAGSGIGRAVALYFAAQDAILSLVDVDVAGLRDTVQHCKPDTLSTIADLTCDQLVAHLIHTTVEQYKKLDIVVNCAGIFRQDTLESGNLLTNFDKTVAINLRGTMAVCHYAAPALIESKGCIVNISSISSLKVVQHTLSYLTTKAGLDHFSRAISMELAPKGVRVNCVLPGVVKTNLNNAEMSAEDMEIYYQGAAQRVPMKRVIAPEEIAEVVGFLASDKAANITGVCLPVDCGYNLASSLSVSVKQ